MEIYNDTYCVYMHTNKINGKIYIGLTSLDVKVRWGGNGYKYLQKHKNGKYHQPIFAYAILKYGWDNFEHEVIASNLTKEEAENFEELLITKLDTRNHDKGYNSQSGGKTKRHSEGTRKKMSETHKEIRGENHPRARAVQCIETGEILWGATAFKEKYGFNTSQIIACCKGKRKTTGGYHWKYYEEAC